MIFPRLPYKGLLTPSEGESESKKRSKKSENYQRKNGKHQRKIVFTRYKWAFKGSTHRASSIKILLEFFLNGAELSLNSVNSEKLINH